MNPHQIDVVQRTFASVAADDDFAVTFYDHLFQLDPSLRSMFPTDLAAQRRKLVDELVAIVDTLPRLPAFIQRTADLGRRHRDYGVEAQHYDLVLDALIVAMSASLGDDMTEDVAVAWRRAYNLVAETMLHGASQT